MLTLCAGGFYLYITKRDNYLVRTAYCWLVLFLLYVILFQTMAGDVAASSTAYGSANTFMCFLGCIESVILGIVAGHEKGRKK